MIGTLMKLDSGRWVIVAKDRDPHELTSGNVFAVEVAGAMRATRMEFAHDGAGGGRYVSVDDIPLREGMRAATGDDMHTEREPTDNEIAGGTWWNGLTDAQRRAAILALQAEGKPPTVAAAWAAEKSRRRN